jgi:hypothetical protein
MSNFSPVIVTVVPPVSGPCVGLILWGMGGGLQPAHPDIQAATSAKTTMVAVFLSSLIHLSPGELKFKYKDCE